MSVMRCRVNICSTPGRFGQNPARYSCTSLKTASRIRVTEDQSAVDLPWDGQERYSAAVVTLSEGALLRDANYCVVPPATTIW